MDISSDHSFIPSLLRDVRSGQLIPAAFQRPYVWERDDVEAMWESVLEGFPVGSFLIWRPYSSFDLADIARGRLGPLAVGEGKSVGVILDGQNRLATMAWAMAGAASPLPSDLSPAESRTWASGMRLTADFDERRVHFVPAAEVETGLRVPAEILCQDHVMRRYLLDNYDRLATANDAIRWLDECSHKFRSARVTVEL